MPRKQPEKRSHGEAFPEAEQAKQDLEEEEEEVPGSNAVIILHPGSSVLHLGLATDHTPHSLPHTIAYRTKVDESVSCDQPQPPDPMLVLQYEVEMASPMQPELEEQRESGLAAIRQALAQSRANLGLLECEVDRKEYTPHNHRLQPVAKESDDLSLTDISASPKYVIGNEVLYLPADSGYAIMKPIRRGKLNVGPRVSLSCVLSQLEDLWTKAVEDYVEIPRKDFKHYRVILVVPDMVDRAMIKDMMDVLLTRMEFAAAFVHQESICATYCAGLSTACVVNVGDEITHVCCVEDGASNPNTRVSLCYGGSDITRLLHWLLMQAGLPYKECSPSSRLDGVLIQQLKESVCHLDPSLHGVSDNQFTVMSKTPGVLLDYEMKLADEALCAPMSVFFPSSFCLPDNCSLMAGQGMLPPHREDLFDEGHWTSEAQYQQNRLVAMATVGAVRPDGAENGVVYEAAKRLLGVNPGRILGLDQAVHFSIDCASSLDMKKKLYSGILLIGGGLAFQGAATMFQSRLELSRPATFARGTDSIEVFANPRELESQVVAWRGAAVLRCLDTCQELWIERQEWEFSGVRLLRERAPFQW